MTEKHITHTLGQLGQIIDGLWFLEVEKQFGFAKAYEIDATVWRVYSRKEGSRLKRALGIAEGAPLSIRDVKAVLEHSLFNQSLSFELETVQTGPVVLRFVVRECKTLVGMRRVERPPDQIHQVCYGIGLIFFENLLGALVPDTRVTCLYCPHDGGDEKRAPGDPVCAWEFTFPPGSLAT